MPYYLSYIEINGHSSLMLSEQKDTSQPTKIICEVGFGYDINDTPQGLGGYFTTHKGQVREETNASRALYSSSAHVKHRTYEISQSEMEQFFILLNNDRRKNTPAISAARIGKGTKQIEVAGGPDYQMITSNCKTYVMGMLKKIGIIDTNQLNNFFIQRTGTKGALLSDVSKDELSCPIKDQTLSALTLLLPNLNEKLIFLIKDIDIEKIRNEIAEAKSAGIDTEQLRNNILKKEFYDNVKKAISLAGYIDKNRDKIGIMHGMVNRFDELNNALAKISAARDNAKILAATEVDEVSFLDTINDLHNIENSMLHMRDMTDRITKLSEAGNLNFFWKTSPPLSKRLSLENFTEQEKAIYKIKVQHNEIVNGLDHILLVIDKKIEESKSVDNDVYSDMLSLKNFIVTTKKTIIDSNLQFHHQINEKDENFVINACLMQKRFLNQTLEGLEKDLSNFGPQSKKETPIYTRFINRLLSYLKKDFFVIDNSAKNILSKYVSTTRKAANDNDFRTSDPAPRLKNMRR